jgi:hypothetical protein
MPAVHSNISRSWVFIVLSAGILVFSVSLISSCASPNRPPVNQEVKDNMAARRNNSWNRHAVDSGISLLHSGDIVMRTGIDVSSYLLSQMNQTNKTYSHCGIVMIENGYPFIYHSIGGEDNPNACLRRDSAVFFFSPYNNMGFGIARYDMQPAAIEKLGTISRQFYREKRKFDMDFDLKTDDRLYCAEFVYKAVIAATGDSSYIIPTSVLGYHFVGVDNLFINPHAQVIWQVKFK